MSRKPRAGPLRLLPRSLVASPHKGQGGRDQLENLPVYVRWSRPRLFARFGLARAAAREGQVLTAGNYFGVAYFKDGRVAVKDFIGAGDISKGKASFKGYSTYTFEDGATLTLSYVAGSTQAGLHGDYTVISGTGAYSNATGSGVFDSVPTKWTDGANLFNVKIDVKTP
jgi:hypothetical protein